MAYFHNIVTGDYVRPKDNAFICRFKKYSLKYKDALTRHGRFDNLRIRN